MNAAFGVGMLVGFLVFVAIAVLIGAVLLRASVSLANRVLPSEGGGDGFPPEPSMPQESFGSANYDPSNPFASPTSAPSHFARNESRAIPEPGFGKACGVVVVNGVVSGIIGAVFGAIAESSPDLAMVGPILNLVIGFIVSSLIYSAMLPTTFGRAALVYLFTILIVIAIALVLLAVVFAVTAAIG